MRSVLLVLAFAVACVCMLVPASRAVGQGTTPPQQPGRPLTPQELEQEQWLRRISQEHEKAQNALWEKHKKKLAFPAGLEGVFR